MPNVCPWQPLCKPDVVCLYSCNIVNQFELRVSDVCLVLQFSVRANPAAPQAATEGQCSSLVQLPWAGRENEIKVGINQQNQHTHEEEVKIELCLMMSFGEECAIL